MSFYHQHHQKSKSVQVFIFALLTVLPLVFSLTAYLDMSSGFIDQAQLVNLKWTLLSMVVACVLGIVGQNALRNDKLKFSEYCNYGFIGGAGTACALLWNNVLTGSMTFWLLVVVSAALFVVAGKLGGLQGNFVHTKKMQSMFADRPGSASA